VGSCEDGKEQIPVPQQAKNFFISCVIISFSRTTLFHWVS